MHPLLFTRADDDEEEEDEDEDEDDNHPTTIMGMTMMTTMMSMSINERPRHARNSYAISPCKD